MIDRDEWQTGDFEVAPTTTYEVIMPDVDWIKRAFLGTLFLLTQDTSWRVSGTASVDNATQTFIDVLNNISEV